MNRVLWKRMALLLLAAMMLLSFTACGMEQELADLGAAALEAALSESTSAPVRTTTSPPLPAAPSTTTAAASKTTAAAKQTDAPSATAAASAVTTTAAATAAATTAAPAPTTAAATTTTAALLPGPVEDGYYYDLEGVVRYLKEYGHLPPNFITKDEAEALGWTGGSVQKYMAGAAIGGDRFGNREGLLPKAKGRSWTECDIDTDGAKSRGARRLVFSSDGLYYYTDDHYESFREVVISDTGEVTFK